MDFRRIDPAAIGWGGAWYRGQPTARLPGGAKVQVQTPPCACTVRLAQPGMFRVELALRPEVPSHSAFAEWLGEVERSVEAAAAASPELQQWAAGKSRSTTVYNGTMRLMAFNDTMAFDREGALSANLMDAAGCACLLELTGCWSTDARWGLRWKIVQIKFDTAPPDLPVTLDPVITDVITEPVPQSYGFMQD